MKGVCRIMKIVLCYKEYELGELEKKDEYIFTPVPGSELAKQKYIVPRASMLLNGGTKKSNKLFSEFAYFFKLLDNPYIRSEANVVSGDDEFTNLTKIARLRLDKGSFYLKIRY